MTFATDLRLMGFALALVALIAGCNTALKPDDAAPKSSATAARSPPAPSASSGSSTTPSRPAPAASGPLPTPAPQPEAPPPLTALQTQLAEAIRLFDAGEFYLAAGRLRNLPDLNAANVETQLTAMKYLAFSYCVTNRRTLCQQQFEAALKVDPKFELAPAERGHPIWKVHFERAKLAVAAGSGSKGSDAPPDNPGDAKKDDPKKTAAKKGQTKKAETKTGDAKKGDEKKGDEKKGDEKKGDEKKGAAKKSEAKTGDAKTSTSMSASQSSRKGAKDEPKTSAGAMMDSRPAPDLKPQ